jgi:DNA-binding XRE family transcriptional regulator
MPAVKKQFGARLKQLREEQGLKVDDVAQWVGVDRTHVYGLERGDVWPSIDLAISLATVYRVDTADLFTFPESHVRHRFRELVRLVPNAKLAASIELVEKFLGTPLVTQGLPKPSLPRAASEAQPPAIASRKKAR